MSLSRAALVLLLALLPHSGWAGTLVHGKAAVAGPREPSIAWRAAPSSRVSEWPIALPPLAAVPKALTSPEDKRMRVGIARDAGEDGLGGVTANLAWSSAPGGGRVAHLRITSSQAQALRVGLSIRGLAAGAELRVAGTDEAPLAPVDAGTIEAAMHTQGVYWTPLTEGDTQVVEIWLPDPAAFAPGVTVTSVSHLVVAPSRLFKSTGPGSSQSCEENVVCVAGRNPALARAASAVAKLLYTENGVSYLCTGTLINDGDASSQVPYMLTAAHCIDSQAAAASLNTFWFFQSASCGGKDATSYKQLSGGASLLFADAASDVSLVRLHDRAPDGAWFSGWDASVLMPGTSAVALHHPAGDVEKVSTGQSFDPAGSPPASYTQMAWLSGSTEGGSSGSGLFTFDGQEYVLRGALRGGSASCTNSGRLDDPSNRDFYSRLDLAAPTLKQWLATTVAPSDDYSGLWSDPAEPGWGLSIAQNAANHVFAAWFTHDAQANATWLVMPGGDWKSAVDLEGTLYRARSSAWDAEYDPAQFTVVPAGSLDLQFNADGTATATFSVDGRSVVKTLQRQPI
jgi:hypothetical protein